MEDGFLDTYWEEQNDMGDPYDAIPFGDAQRFEDNAVAEDLSLEDEDFVDVPVPVKPVTGNHEDDGRECPECGDELAADSFCDLCSRASADFEERAYGIDGVSFISGSENY